MRLFTLASHGERTNQGKLAKIGVDGLIQVIAEPLVLHQKEAHLLVFNVEL